MKQVVTIDGVVCSGKGTVAKSVAKALGWLHMSSGEIYRAIGYGAYVALGVRQEVYTEEAITALLETMDVQIFVEDGQVRYVVDGDDVTHMLGQEQCARAASWVAPFAVVRAKALQVQHAIAGEYALVIDGRDCGTKVFPDAKVKIFLTAEVEVRAQRRTTQLQRRGIDAVYEEILQDLRARDEKDMTRTLDPLVPAQDAVIIDTTHRTLADEVEEIVGLVRERGMV